MQHASSSFVPPPPLPSSASASKQNSPILATSTPGIGGSGGRKRMSSNSVIGREPPLLPTNTQDITVDNTSNFGPFTLMVGRDGVHERVAVSHPSGPLIPSLPFQTQTQASSPAQQYSNFQSPAISYPQERMNSNVMGRGSFELPPHSNNPAFFGMPPHTSSYSSQNQIMEYLPQQPYQHGSQFSHSPSVRNDFPSHQQQSQSNIYQPSTYSNVEEGNSSNHNVAQTIPGNDMSYYPPETNRGSLSQASAFHPPSSMTMIASPTYQNGRMNMFQTSQLSAGNQGLGIVPSIPQRSSNQHSPVTGFAIPRLGSGSSNPQQFPNSFNETNQASGSKSSATWSGSIGMHQFGMDLGEDPEYDDDMLDDFGLRDELLAYTMNNPSNVGLNTEDQKRHTPAKPMAMELPVKMPEEPKKELLSSPALGLPSISPRRSVHFPGYGTIAHASPKDVLPPPTSFMMQSKASSPAGLNKVHAFGLKSPQRALEHEFEVYSNLATSNTDRQSVSVSVSDSHSKGKTDKVHLLNFRKRNQAQRTKVIINHSIQMPRTDKKYASLHFGPENWKFQLIVFPQGTGDASGQFMSAFVKPIVREVDEWMREVSSFSLTCVYHDRRVSHTTDTSFTGFSNEVNGWGFMEFLPLADSENFLDPVTGSFMLECEINGVIISHATKLDCQLPLNLFDAQNQLDFVVDSWLIRMKRTNLNAQAHNIDMADPSTITRPASPSQSKFGVTVHISPVDPCITSFDSVSISQLDADEIERELKSITSGWYFDGGEEDKSCGWDNICAYPLSAPLTISIVYASGGEMGQHYRKAYMTLKDIISNKATQITKLLEKLEVENKKNLNANSFEDAFADSQRSLEYAREQIMELQKKEISLSSVKAVLSNLVEKMKKDLSATAFSLSPGTDGVLLANSQTSAFLEHTKKEQKLHSIISHLQDELSKSRFHDPSMTPVLEEELASISNDGAFPASLLPHLNSAVHKIRGDIAVADEVIMNVLEELPQLPDFDAAGRAGLCADVTMALAEFEVSRANCIEIPLELPEFKEYELLEPKVNEVRRKLKSIITQLDGSGSFDAHFFQPRPSSPKLLSIVNTATSPIGCRQTSEDHPSPKVAPASPSRLSGQLSPILPGVSELVTASTLDGIRQRVVGSGSLNSMASNSALATSEFAQQLHSDMKEMKNVLQKLQESIDLADTWSEAVGEDLGTVDQLVENVNTSQPSLFCVGKWAFILSGLSMLIFYGPAIAFYSSVLPELPAILHPVNDALQHALYRGAEWIPRGFNLGEVIPKISTIFPSVNVGNEFPLSGADEDVSEQRVREEILPDQMHATEVPNNDPQIMEKIPPESQPYASAVISEGITLHPEPMRKAPSEQPVVASQQVPTGRLRNKILDALRPGNNRENVVQHPPVPESQSGDILEKPLIVPAKVPEIPEAVVPVANNNNQHLTEKKIPLATPDTYVKVLPNVAPVRSAQAPDLPPASPSVLKPVVKTPKDSGDVPSGPPVILDAPVISPPEVVPVVPAQASAVPPSISVVEVKESAASIPVILSTPVSGSSIPQAVPPVVETIIQRATSDSSSNVTPLPGSPIVDKAISSHVHPAIPTGVVAEGNIQRVPTVSSDIPGSFAQASQASPPPAREVPIKNDAADSVLTGAAALAAEASTPSVVNVQGPTVSPDMETPKEHVRIASNPPGTVPSVASPVIPVQALPSPPTDKMNISSPTSPPPATSVEVPPLPAPNIKNNDQIPPADFASSPDVKVNIQQPAASAPAVPVQVAPVISVAIPVMDSNIQQREGTSATAPSIAPVAQAPSHSSKQAIMPGVGANRQPAVAADSNPKIAKGVPAQNPSAAPVIEVNTQHNGVISPRVAQDTAAQNSQSPNAPRPVADTSTHRAVAEAMNSTVAAPDSPVAVPIMTSQVPPVPRSVPLVAQRSETEHPAVSDLPIQIVPGQVVPDVKTLPPVVQDYIQSAPESTKPDSVPVQVSYVSVAALPVVDTVPARPSTTGDFEVAPSKVQHPAGKDLSGMVPEVYLASPHVTETKSHSDLPDLQSQVHSTAGTVFQSSSAENVNDAANTNENFVGSIAEPIQAEIPSSTNSIFEYEEPIESTSESDSLNVYSTMNADMVEEEALPSLKFHQTLNDEVAEASLDEGLYVHPQSGKDLPSVSETPSGPVSPPVLDEKNYPETPDVYIDEAMLLLKLDPTPGVPVVGEQPSARTAESSEEYKHTPSEPVQIAVAKSPELGTAFISDSLNSGSSVPLPPVVEANVRLPILTEPFVESDVTNTIPNIVNKESNDSPLPVAATMSLSSMPEGQDDPQSEFPAEDEYNSFSHMLENRL